MISGGTGSGGSLRLSSHFAFAWRRSKGIVLTHACKSDNHTYLDFFGIGADIEVEGPARDLKE